MNWSNNGKRNTRNVLNMNNVDRGFSNTGKAIKRPDVRLKMSDIQTSISSITPPASPRKEQLSFDKIISNDLTNKADTIYSLVEKNNEPPQTPIGQKVPTPPESNSDTLESDDDTYEREQKQNEVSDALNEVAALDNEAPDKLTNVVNNIKRTKSSGNMSVSAGLGLPVSNDVKSRYSIISSPLHIGKKEEGILGKIGEEVIKDKPSSIYNNSKDDDEEKNLQEGYVEFDIQDLYEYCLYKRESHYICAKHYGSLNKKFVIPVITLTSLSGIMSFLSSSNYFDELATKTMSLVVGFTASVSALVQSISNTFAYSSKSQAHENAVISYDQIIAKLKFHLMRYGNIANEKEIDNIEKQIFEARQRCKFILPEWVNKKLTLSIYEYETHKALVRKKHELLRYKMEKIQRIEEKQRDLFNKEINGITNLTQLRKNSLINDELHSFNSSIKKM